MNKQVLRILEMIKMLLIKKKSHLKEVEILHLKLTNHSYCSTALPVDIYSSRREGTLEKQWIKNKMKI